MTASNSSLNFFTPTPWKSRINYHDSFTLGHSAAHRQQFVRAFESSGDLASISCNGDCKCKPITMRKSNFLPQHRTILTYSGDGRNLSQLNCIPDAERIEINSKAGGFSPVFPVCGNNPRRFFRQDNGHRTRDRFKQRLAACQLGMAELQALRNKHRQMVAQLRNVLLTDRTSDAGMACEHSAAIFRAKHNCSVAPLARRNNLSPTPSTGDVSSASYRSSVSMDSGCCLSNDLSWSEKSFNHSLTKTQPSTAKCFQSLTNAFLTVEKLPKMTNDKVIACQSQSTDRSFRSTMGAQSDDTHRSTISANGEKGSIEDEKFRPFYRPFRDIYASSNSLLWSYSQTDADESPPKPPIRYRRRGIKPPKDKRPSSLYTYPEENVIFVGKTGLDLSTTFRAEDGDRNPSNMFCPFSSTTGSAESNMQQMAKFHSVDFIPLKSFSIIGHVISACESEASSCAQSDAETLLEEPEKFYFNTEPMNPNVVTYSLQPENRNTNELSPLTSGINSWADQTMDKNDAYLDKYCAKINRRNELSGSLLHNQCEDKMPTTNSYELLHDINDLSPDRLQYSSENKEENSRILAAGNNSNPFLAANHFLADLPVDDLLKTGRRPREKSWYESPSL